MRDRHSCYCSISPLTTFSESHVPKSCTLMESGILIAPNRLGQCALEPHDSKPTWFVPKKSDSLCYHCTSTTATSHIALHQEASHERAQRGVLCSLHSPHRNAQAVTVRFCPILEGHSKSNVSTDDVDVAPPNDRSSYT